MISLAAFENNNKDETSKKTSAGGKKFFLAKITKSKRVADNQYIYAWTKVTKNATNYYDFTDTTTTSTGASDEWDFAAINLLEILNTSIRSSAGVSMEGQYPSGWTMQAMGGGSADAEEEITLGGVIVLMHQIGGTNTETVKRFVFSNVNEHDGTCSTTALAVTDGIATPDIPSEATYGYIYIAEDGTPKFIDKDENIVTFDTT